MMKKFFAIISLLLSIISCSNVDNSNGQFEIVALEEDALPIIQPLQLEKIDLLEDYTMGDGDCIIYQDTILIVLKDGDPYPLTHILTLVNMNSGQKIGEYFTRGMGPDELLSELQRFSHNHVDINCYTTGKLVSFNIDSAIVYGNDYKPNIIQPTNYSFGEWSSMDDTLFLTSNSFYFDGDIKECKENAKLPEFYWYSKSGKFTPEYKESDYRKIKYMTSDVSGSTISINKKKNRVVCCYLHQPIIKVFDSNLKLIKIIKGPEPDDGKYIPIKDMNFIYFDENVGNNYYYSLATCDDDNIFVINNRIHKYKDGPYHFSEKKCQNTEIFRLDWNGNVIGRYSAKGKEIFYGNYSKNSNSLYLWTNEDGEGCMYKAKLD